MLLIYKTLQSGVWLLTFMRIILPISRENSSNHQSYSGLITNRPHVKTQNIRITNMLLQPM
jgi:hypothetical protein